ncbi:MAG: chromophore lyase CpcT/CpeT [Planctomycetota bacterium]
MFVALAILASCASHGRSSGGDDVATAAAWLTGTFSSAAQAAEDPANFFDVRLVVAPIWKERDDGPWLYVEQAVATALDRPYRQRVYHLVPEGDTVRSDVYELPDAAAAVGCFEQDRPLAELGPDDLALRGGCSIWLVRVAGDEFRGSTRGDGCPSTLGGATHATSEVVLGPDALESWDRGFDASGRQVWGATRGAYRFDRTFD